MKRTSVRARRECFERSQGECQLCGARKADEAHHWKMEYEYGSETADDLTALCLICHKIATCMRRMNRAGYSMFDFRKLVDEAVARLESGDALPDSVKPFDDQEVAMRRMRSPREAVSPIDGLGNHKPRT